ncbi:hypothetical protein [Chryseobacterium turcicum]|uniref:Uncharacterized protein n=1 Tax=Chryseobacterium turcicum TaxID=2898076 RepID=A0A9Q3V0J8_9FLAO|nr:hypothetical protein [Chryseobacterium turcicum]MCD1115606.1 hypothetical protein [Chryseobacterium turcicum]
MEINPEYPLNSPEAIELALKYYRELPITRQIIQSRLTAKEIAELSLAFEGECDISKETIQKTDAIWLEVLKEFNPLLHQYEISRKKS